MFTEKMLRRIRNSSLPDTDPLRANMLLEYLKARLERQRTKPATGPFSGLTKEELRRTGTSETDWF